MKFKKYSWLFTLLLVCLMWPSTYAQKIIMGDEQMDVLLPLISGKNIALMVNQTSVIGRVHLVDSLLHANVRIKKIFSAEHGFRGTADAGETVNNSIDQATGIPVVSLYGKNKKPTAEDLKDVDIVIFDIQDVGTRFFTYISSMHYLMEGCAENGKKMIILDRPNPNGHYVDGPVLDLSLKSFVGMHPIPIVHGLTIGELGRMINGEGWLPEGKKCDLTIVPMKNYNHQKKYSLPIKPSPNLPNDHAIALYPSLCLFEGTVLSVGRGTKIPFEALGSPELKNQPFQFKPENIEGMAKSPMYQDKICYGVDLRNEQPGNLIELKYLLNMYKVYPDKEKFFNNYFNTLAGNKLLKEQIKQGIDEDTIRASWKKGLDAYKKIRKKYLLYP
ncbi:MAG: DUF1343 domain-containing protein [Bacteroidetes bacterium]|nr:DUF1343 domain-containing protein [Bacteroidota bacterium]MBS1541017.1 DUF1343 domain-containing protein [Bacteroidota bacterium]